jgi:hypothetical protein
MQFSHSVILYILRRVSLLEGEGATSFIANEIKINSIKIYVILLAEFITDMSAASHKPF